MSTNEHHMICFWTWKGKLYLVLSLQPRSHFLVSKNVDRQNEEGTQNSLPNLKNVHNY